MITVLTDFLVFGLTLLFTKPAKMFELLIQLLFIYVEIRQEAVKAALAMYSNQKQSLIISSKRNTAYVQPNLVNENPFPVNYANCKGEQIGAIYSGRLSFSYRNIQNRYQGIKSTLCLNPRG